MADPSAKPTQGTFQTDGAGTGEVLLGHAGPLDVRREAGHHRSVAETLVEIHVPLVATSDLTDGDYQFPWIEDIEDFLVDLEDRGEVEVFDDGEEHEDVYIFFISGADEPALLAVASRVAKLHGVPPGAFAVVTDDEADEYGQGRRVELASS